MAVVAVIAAGSCDGYRYSDGTAIGIGNSEGIVACSKTSLCRSDRIRTHTTSRSDHYRSGSCTITDHIGDGSSCSDCSRLCDRYRYSDRTVVGIGNSKDVMCLQQDLFVQE